MNPPIQRKSKMILLFSAVLLFQCCCCIIPYSWSTNFESFTLGSPFQIEEEINIPARESLNAEAIEEKYLERIVQTEEMDAGTIPAADEDLPVSIIQGMLE